MKLVSNDLRIEVIQQKKNNVKVRLYILKAHAKCGDAEAERRDAY